MEVQDPERDRLARELQAVLKEIRLHRIANKQNGGLRKTDRRLYTRTERRLRRERV